MQFGLNFVALAAAIAALTAHAAPAVRFFIIKLSGRRGLGIQYDLRDNGLAFGWKGQGGQGSGVRLPAMPNQRYVVRTKVGYGMDRDGPDLQGVEFSKSIESMIWKTEVVHLSSQK
ncbi:hypothetical protein B0H14DRAFT_2583195 [Mycena olivaceomarginata]|nr:hypothetical protein B0H14DRAFT_2583195 [Mycena olivaceomarginata]